LPRSGAVVVVALLRAAARAVLARALRVLVLRVLLLPALALSWPRRGAHGQARRSP
jgi:hypothetical protein